MNIKNSFLKKISIYFIGTLSSNLINVLLVPVYAYFVLADDLGEYDYILSIANMIAPIVFLVVWESILKYGIIQKEKEVDKYLSTAVLFATISTFLCGMIFVGLFFAGVDFIILILIFSFIVVQGWTTVWQYSARAIGESKQYVISGIVGSITVIVCDILYVICAKLDFIGLSISHILSQVTIILVLELRVKLFRKVCIGNFDIKILKRMLRFSVPLVVNNVCLWFYSGGNKVIVRNCIGATENGLYSFAAKFSILINLCSTIVSMAVIEEAYSYSSIEEYREKIGRLIAIISKAYFSMITLALPAIYILYTFAFKNTDYYESSKYVLMLLLSALFTALSNNFGSSFQVTDNTKYISITTILGAACSLSVSWFLVQYIGIWGVLIGAVFGPFVMMVSRALYAKKATGLCINWKENIMIFSLAILSAFMLAKYKTVIIQIFVFMFDIILIFMMYRKEISYFLIKKSSRI